MAISAGLSRSEARCAIKQSDVPEMHGVLTYAEAYGIIAAGLGVTMGDPARLVRRLVDETLRGVQHWMPKTHTFTAHLRKAARLEITSHMTLHARMRGNTPAIWEARLAVAQVGDLRGVEQLGHWAGEMMRSIRSDDSATLHEAIKLTHFVRTRLAPFAGEPDDEDTARLRAPAVVAIALDDAERDKPN